MIDQNTEPLIVAIASGYTMKTRPGPSSPTWSIEVFCTWAMYLKRGGVKVAPFRNGILDLPQNGEYDETG